MRASFRLIPETKGRSLEEMDVIFGSVSADQRQADIARQERGECLLLDKVLSWLVYRRSSDADALSVAALDHHHNETTSERSIDNKV